MFTKENMTTRAYFSEGMIQNIGHLNIKLKWCFGLNFFQNTKQQYYCVLKSYILDNQ